jgi:acetolactate synthase small subunit
MIAHNKPDVLARIALVLHRYDTNIERLHMEPTADASISRVQVELGSSPERIGLVCRRLNKLMDVLKVDVGT